MTPDNDAAGEQYLADVVELLRALPVPPKSIRDIRLEGLPAKGDVCVWLEGRDGQEATDIARELEALAGVIAPESFLPASVAVTCLADVTPQSVSYIWEKRLQRRAVCMVASPPGKGKTFVALDLAARVTTGSPFPCEDRSRTALQSVVLVLVEDDLADTIYPRFEAAGGDPKRALAVHHNNKSGDKNALNRIMGSTAFSAIARQVFTVIDDPDDPTGRARLLAHAKASTCALQSALRFRIASTSAGIGYVEWDAVPVEATADQLCRAEAEQAEPSEPSTIDEAVDWLRRALAKGPVLSKDLYEKGTAEGHSKRAIERARKELRVTADQQRDAKNRVLGWFVSLPTMEVPT